MKHWELKKTMTSGKYCKVVQYRDIVGVLDILMYTYYYYYITTTNYSY